MSNKKSRNYNKNNKNNKRDTARATAAKRAAKKRNGAFLRFVLVVISLAAGFGIIASVTFAFPVKTVELYGQSIYTSDEVLSAAAIGQGQNIVTLSAAEINDRVTGQLPYIESVEMSKNINGIVALTITPAKEAFCVISGNKKYIISDKNKVLDTVDEIPEGMPIIKGVFVQDADIGGTFEISDESISRVYSSVTENIELYSLNCDLIDLSDTVNITFRIENRIVVELGSVTNIDEKFRHLNSMLKSIDSEATGIINLKLWAKNKPEGYFRTTDIGQYYQ